MKKYLALLIILCSLKLAVHVAGNGNYGFHRDELLHLSVSEHLDWGYMEFPPFIAAMGKFSNVLFDYDLFGVRLFSTIAGIVILVVCCWMTQEFGGDIKAFFLAGICMLTFLPFFRNHTLFQPVAFDQMFWTLGFYFLLRFLSTDDAKYLYLIAFTAGLGLMNKYTFLIWGVGLVVGLLVHKKAITFRGRHLYIAGALVVLIILPNVYWQYTYDFPIVMHHQKLQELQLAELGVFDFVLTQLTFPFTLIISVIGVVGVFRIDRLKRFIPAMVAVLTIFILMWGLRSKGYYFFSAYPLLFAAGSVVVVNLVKSEWKWVATIATILLITSVPFIPKLAPILPIEKLVAYEGIEQSSSGRYILTDDYADMFGWEEQVRVVDSLYRSLNQEDRERCAIWAQNYGEAGAIKVLGDRFDLPDPVCIHGSFWLWGPGPENAVVWISVANEPQFVSKVFDEVTLVKTIKHPYAIEEEQNIPIYLCRKMKVNFHQKWPDFRQYVFD